MDPTKPSPQSDPAAEDVAMQRFLKWMLDNGASFPKVEIRRYSRNFRGVHALSDIHKGERVLTIPQKVILTESCGWEKSALGAKIKASGVKINFPYCTYIGCVLFDAKANPAHEFRPYLDIFPTDAATFPFFYSDTELVELAQLSINRIPAGAQLSSCRADSDGIRDVEGRVRAHSRSSARIRHRGQLPRLPPGRGAPLQSQLLLLQRS